MCNLLFVYGTLIKGEQNSSILKDCPLIDYRWIQGSLYDLGDYPGAVLDFSKNKIFGELRVLPENKSKRERLLNLLDKIEEKNNLFSRKRIKINNKPTYIYEALDVSKGTLINHGSWLKHRSLSSKNPSAFAINFEKIQESSYRKRSNRYGENIYLKGDIPILITAPHSTTHRRKGKLKRFETFTAAIVTILHAKTKAHVLYSNSFQETDPNYYDDNSFKKEIEKIISNNEIKIGIDIHGTGEKRSHAIYPGMGANREFIRNKEEIAKTLEASFRSHGIEIGSEHLFPAYKQKTVSRYLYNSGIYALQIEINKRYRKPFTNSYLFNNMIESLAQLVKNLHHLLT